MERQKMNTKMGPKIDFDPTSIRKPHAMGSPLGMFSFNFGQKFDFNHAPSFTSFLRQKWQKSGFSEVKFSLFVYALIRLRQYTHRSSVHDFTYFFPGARSTQKLTQEPLPCKKAAWHDAARSVQKKEHGCSSHIPCFKSSCFAASEKQFENFRFRANVDKRLWAVAVGRGIVRCVRRRVSGTCA